MPTPIPTRIEPSSRPSDQTPAQVEREFRRLLEAGMPIRPAGSARQRPRTLLTQGYTPKHRVQVFDTTFYLTNVRQNEFIRYFVAYLVQGDAPVAYPRILYKDVSLAWRSASHTSRLNGDLWIGKGDTVTEIVDGEEMLASDEATTDLPLEVQSALESLIRGVRRIPLDETVIEKVLRRGPEGRIEPYRDFTEPRRRAEAEPRNRIHGGRRIARFTRRNDPTSLRFAAGYEPDFGRGVLETEDSSSRLYGGRLRRFRILSKNRRIQYLFFAGPKHVWIIPPQATTTELSSYGVRTVYVKIDEDLCLPGYEYHFVGDDGELVTQIPKGFAGESSPVDDLRADASAWIDRMPVIREFRRKVLRWPASKT
jgi:hypothetical protein